MTPEQSKTAEKTKSVKAAWDKAPAAPKKGAALKHYPAAEDGAPVLLPGDQPRR
jgi:hypothetical protein